MPIDDLEIEIPTPNLIEKDEIPSSQEEEDALSSEEETPTLGPREEIYARFDEKNRPTEKGGSEEEEELADPEEAAEEPEVPEVPEVETSDEEEPVVSMTKVKVYGREFEVETAKVEAAGGKVAYQKELAAMEKAQIQREREFNESEAARLEAERVELERIKSVPPKDEPEAATDLPSDDQKEKTRDAIKVAAEGLLDGDVDEFTDNIMDMLTQRTEPGEVDIDAIVEKVRSETAQTMEVSQRKQELSKAFQDFSVEYPELIKDPELYQEVDIRTNIHAQRHPEKSPLEIMRMAGDEVVKLFLPDNQLSHSDANKKVRDDKKAEKRTMTKPRGSSVRSTKAPEPKQPTRSDYIEQLKRERGQI